MIIANYTFLEVPKSPLSVWQLLKLSCAAYKGSIRLGWRLFLLPCAILLVCNLPMDFAAASRGEADLTQLLKDGALAMAGFLGWTFFILGGVVRTVALRRLILLPEDGCASSIAYANRTGWKSVVARVVTGGCQLLIANLILFAWIAAFVRDLGTSPWAALQAAVQQVPAMIGGAVCLLLAYICWSFLEFLYTCFSTQLAIEDASWDALISQSLRMVRSAFWRGCNFSFALQFFFGICSYFLSPLTIYNLPTLLSFDIEKMSAAKPLALSLADSGTTLLTNLLFLPFVAIFSAYFVNDVRLRIQNQRDREANAETGGAI